MNRRLTPNTCVCYVDSRHVCYGCQAIRGHVQSAHPGCSVHPCGQCQQIFYSDANQRRHVAMVHRHCCDICGDGISFHDNAALRQHIAVEHNEHVCVFCGHCFLDESALALHQDRHCTRGFKCMMCDQEFPTLTLCNVHMTTHRMVGGGMSSCFVDGPSQLAYNLTRNRLETESYRPWEAEAYTAPADGDVAPEPPEPTTTADDIMTPDIVTSEPPPPPETTHPQEMMPPYRRDEQEYHALVEQQSTEQQELAQEHEQQRRRLLQDHMQRSSNTETLVSNYSNTNTTDYYGSDDDRRCMPPLSRIPTRHHHHHRTAPYSRRRQPSSSDSDSPAQGYEMAYNTETGQLARVEPLRPTLSRIAPSHPTLWRAHLEAMDTSRKRRATTTLPPRDSDDKPEPPPQPMERNIKGQLRPKSQLYPRYIQWAKYTPDDLTDEPDTICLNNPQCQPGKCDKWTCVNRLKPFMGIAGSGRSRQTIYQRQAHARR